MGVEVGGFEVAEAPAGASSIPVPPENGKVDVGVNGGAIKFGSHGDEQPDKVEASKVADGPKDAVDEWPAPRQVHSFYFIRYRPYDDVKLKAKKELIEKDVEKKTQARFQITEKIRAKKTDRAEIISQLKALGVEDKQYWAIIDEKRKEMAPLQQALGQLRNPNGARGGERGGLCSSEQELDDLIRSLNYRMQHESIPLSEEKQILKEIKALEQTRPQVVANAAKRAEIQGSMGQKETIQGQVKLIGGDLDGVRKEKQVIREKIKELEKQLNDLNQEINKLETERQTVSESRDKAYETRQQLNKQRNDANAHFYENRSLLNTARDLAAKRDVKGLEQLASDEVEKFMAQWNDEKAFREDYEKRILSSLDNRFLSRDGRMRNPEEKPLVVVEAPTPAVSEAKAGAKKAKEEVKEAPAPVSEKTKEETKPKGEGKAKPAVAEVSKQPAVPKDDDDVYIPPKVVSKAVEVDPEKLKEQKRQEEIAKAKQATERKKKLAEKAAAKAAVRAQKEAEKKLKDKEKKAKKKAGATTANNESEEPTETTEDADPVENEEEKADEEPAPVSTKARQTKNVVRQKVRSRATGPLPKAILKRKKAANYWQWAAPAGAVLVVLLLLGYYYFQM
uniref:Proton pump-interactor 1 n=1 Tax=Kalanchoe fedtschenkoi TaxID=63787 RepID=A0A7N0SXU9_KALFE